ncbi:MAG TPA: hypothetical protein VK797_07935 [Tepidisphaeraceae bacterium]|jgi:hypothetical protein|nr:hypothetical protein [Tepidisphaeraceae bacterium]
MPAIYGISSGWIVLALLGLYLFGALYVYAPLKIRRQQTKDLNVDFTPIELPALPPDVSQAFYEGSRGLVTCGFHAIGHLTHHVGNTRQNAYVSIWINPSVCDAAQIIGVCTPSPVAHLRVVTLVTFRTEFKDGTAIVTTSSPSASSFPRDPRVSSIRCPGIRDFALLYRFHRARVDRDRAGRTPTLDRVQDPLSRMELEHRETYERLVRAGYYWLDPTGQKYVPTIMGAYLMTYRLLPPFKQIQKLNRDRLAERTLRELGFGGMEAFRRAQSPAALADITF